ncbi:type II toxin-antitoxin system RelE/ParE family toxin [Lacticaseibacillus parakribbianus]|uniref:type II toxin-antitoxin system RelE/ParE family toxin n=1 Tax=Lacticaseibacillus parakribbianus TaxID=2970927 RepID=UPI003B84AF69
MLRKISYQMSLLQMQGPALGMPHAKALRGFRYPLHELRPLPERVFYSPWRPSTYVILNHFTKRRDKTDPRQVQRAVILMTDWMRRKGN